MYYSFKELLSKETKLVGGTVSTAAYDMAESVAFLGADFAVIEGEHGLLNNRDIVRLLRAFETYKFPKIVSVPEANKYHVEMVLNMGADCVILPCVKSAEDAREVVALTKFAPDGIRSAFPCVRAGRYGGKSAADFFAEANQNICVGFRLGHPGVLKNIEEIAAVPGVDFFDINLYDLSLHMGKGGHIDAELKAYVNDLAAKVHNAGKKLGGFVYNIEDAKDLLKNAYDYVAHGTVDSLVLADLKRNLPYIMEGFWK